MAKCLLGPWIDLGITNTVEKIAEIKGISLSEYLRSLVLKIREERNIITTTLKET